MNSKLVFNTLGKVILIEVAFMLLPLFVAIGYRESSVISFLITIAIALIVGLALVLFCKPKEKNTFLKDGTAIVVLSWIVMSVIGSLPFVFSKEIPNFFDAFFETVSGFTTTGASIVPNVEVMSHGILFWRSLTHWLGGMGVLVFVLAITSKGQNKTMNILKAEMPGPSVEKISPKAATTARILYTIYLALTFAEVAFLIFGGMPIFDSFVHAFGTAGTGGFGIKANSIGAYSAYHQWVITIFMLLFGVSFNFYFLLLLKNFKAFLKCNELWVYLGVFLVSSVVIGFNIYPLYSDAATCARLSAFQVSSIVTTTGFATADFNIWPQLSRSVLLLLMFFGGCAGSTAGGLKMSRVVILFQSVKNEIRRNVRPRSVTNIKLNGKNIDETMEKNVISYFAIYVIIHIIIILMISFEPYDFETNFTAVVSCINNIGPGLSQVGPAANFAGYTYFTKVVLSIAMLMGRLEIYPLLMVIYPEFWSKRSR